MAWQHSASSSRQPHGYLSAVIGTVLLLAFSQLSEAFTTHRFRSTARDPFIQNRRRGQCASAKNEENEDSLIESDNRKEYLATCIPGLAPYLEEELLSCGASSTQILSNAAVSFVSESTDDATIDSLPLKVILWVRTAHRILEKIDTFYDIESRDDVYNAVQDSRLHIKDLLGDGQGGLLSLSVKVIANGGRLPQDISHSHYTALTIKNALVDQVRDLKGGERPNVDLDDPDVPLVAIFHSTGATADMTLYRSLAPPGSLHKRGYRAGGAIHKAAMKESLAAGLLLAAGWKDACDRLRTVQDKSDNNNDDNRSSSSIKSNSSNSHKGLTLIDPMCGSGTLLLEAAMMAVDFAPGLMRIINGVPGHQIPPVLRWRKNKETLLPLWKEMLLDASQRVKSGLSSMRQNEGKVEILGNDIHGGALELAEASLAKAGGLNRIVSLHQNDCSEWNILMKEGRENQQVWVMTNPPWGVRLSDDEHESWESLRTFLRSNCPPGRTQAWVLSGNKSATKHLGLKRSQSVVIRTGQQDLRWIQYIMLDRGSSAPRDYAGTADLSASPQPTSAPLMRDNMQRLIRTRSKSSPPAKGEMHVQNRERRRIPTTGGNASKADDSWI